MSLEAQSIVIIGGSSGIGLAIAKEAVDAGADVTIAGRSQGKLDQARQAIAGDVATCTVDLSDEDSVKRLFLQIGSFDHLVVTGSSVKTGPFRELSLADARASMDSKFWGQYLAARYAQIRPMILITGATGNNGQELIRQLTAAGQRVRALVRKPAEAAKLDGSNIELATGDFDLPETLEAALQGVEKAFLLTPVAERFVQWQKDFIEAAQRAKVKHLVKFSGMGAHARSASLLLKLHAKTDDILRNSGVPFTILQPNSFHQNMLSSANTIKAQGMFYWPLKNASQSTVDIRDISAVAAKVFASSGHEGKTYVITGPETLTFQQAAEKLFRARPENSVR